MLNWCFQGPCVRLGFFERSRIMFLFFFCLKSQTVFPLKHMFSKGPSIFVLLFVIMEISVEGTVTSFINFFLGNYHICSSCGLLWMDSRDRKMEFSFCSRVCGWLHVEKNCIMWNNLAKFKTTLSCQKVDNVKRVASLLLAVFMPIRWHVVYSDLRFHWYRQHGGAWFERYLRFA